MIRQTGDNIISSLGFTSAENYESVKAGRSGVRRYENGMMGLPEPFMASLIDRERLNDCFASLGRTDGYTPLEKAAILSVRDASQQAQTDLSGARVLFLLATTKGNVHLLDECETGRPPDAAYLWHSAQRIAAFFGNANTPVTVSNACISGACVQLEALRQLETGRYDCAVVTGVDMLSRFIISGFASFKALSPGRCRPFDASHDGLNLGEAASTIIYQRADGADHGVALVGGAVRNDANHISGPSRTGEGSFLALQSVANGLDTTEIAFINAHGTATAYNDRMEAIAIARAGLDSVPVNGLKGHFGHTLGAAGVLESVISSHAAADHTILPTLGFETGDTALHIADRPAGTEKPYFIKMLSGFGGCNAALLFRSSPSKPPREAPHRPATAINGQEKLYIYKYSYIGGGQARVDGQPVFVAGTEQGNEFLAALYRSLKTDYPKFFKMDGLSKLGFLASELIFGDEAVRFEPRRDMAVVCFNRSASLEADLAYQETIRPGENYFPSPSVFVYTLPNIVAAEIAIRNRIFGETSFFVAEHFDAGQTAAAVSHAFRNADARYVLTAWVEYSGGRYETLMLLTGNTPPTGSASPPVFFSTDELNRIYLNQTKYTTWMN